MDRSPASTLALFLVLCPSLAGQTAKLPVPSQEIRRVLLLARDAALHQERAEGGMGGGWLPDWLQTLMTGFRTIDDWQDALALQKHVSKLHRVDVLSAPPHATLADYESLRDEARQFDSQWDRSTALQRLISQELADGFTDDAELAASSVSDASLRSQTYTDIAVFLWKHGQQEAANQYFESAIDAAMKMKDTFMVNSIGGVARELSNIARRRFEVGDESGTVAMFERLNAMVLDSEKSRRDLLCRASVRTQAELGLFEGALNSLHCIDNNQDRKSLANEITDKRIATLEPARAIATASTASDREGQVGLLVDLASKESSAGNKTEAIEALDRVMETFQKFSANNVNAQAAGYQLRMTAQTYLQLGEPDKGKLALERLSALKQATRSTRDQYDFLYDLAVGFASLGFFDQSHAYVREMGKYPNEQACNVVGYEQARQRQAEQAVSWAKELKDPAARTAALVGIAEALLEANKDSSETNER